MILLDNVDASQELQVAHVNVVSLASGTIVHMDVSVSQKINMVRIVMKLPVDNLIIKGGWEMHFFR
jgi:hypothetical protein